MQCDTPFLHFTVSYLGISNEAACLHALEATGGDVEAAIGLLL